MSLFISELVEETSWLLLPLLDIILIQQILRIHALLLMILMFALY